MKGTIAMFFLSAICTAFLYGGMSIESYTSTRLVLRAEIDTWNLKDGRLSLEKTGGDMLSVLIAVPERGNPQIRLEVNERRVLNAPKSAGGATLELLGPFRFRDFNVAILNFRPIEREKETAYLITDARIIIDFPAPPTTSREPSLTFYPLYRGTILNFGQASQSIRSYRRGGMLIITHDDFYDAVLPLAEWKNLKGFSTEVVKLSQIGSSPTANNIKNYIQNYYESHDPKPDFVLLVGNKNYIPSFTYQMDITDHPYSLLEGNDYFPDVIVGRLSVSDPYKAEVLVAKILGYEKNPYLGETAWYRRALMSAGIYVKNFEEVNTTKLTKLWAKEKLEEMGYEVDTVFGYESGGGGTTEDLMNSINQGVYIVNYRGWSNTLGWIYPSFLTGNILSLENGWKQPVMFSMTCGTGNFASPPCFGEVWIGAGSPEEPKGGPAFFGPSDLLTHTRWNNAIDVGIFQGLLHEGDRLFGQATTRGLFELLRQFPGRTSPYDSSGCVFYFYVYNILGDPSLEIWSDVPRDISVDVPEALPVGSSYITVTVSSGGAPVEGAYVNLVKDDEVYAGGLTDENGTFCAPVETQTPGTLQVVVSGADVVPAIEMIPVVSRGLYVGFESLNLNDENGNGDGVPNPGETLELEVTLKNYGSDLTANDVSAVLSTPDTNITILDSVADYGDINPQATASPSAPFRVSLSGAIPDSSRVPFELRIQSGDSLFVSGFEITVLGPDLFIKAIQIDDEGDDGYMDPGESGDLFICLENRGSAPSGALTAYLLHGYMGFEFVDSITSYENIDPADTASNTAPFSLHLSPNAARGRRAKLYLKLIGETGYTRTLAIPLYISSPNENYPSGPDSYGYWAYDNSDTDYSEAPEFQWIELDPDYGGNGTPLNLGNDGLVLLDLPFDFRFYGNDFDYITISNNGWAAFDTTRQFSPRNWRIPSPFGPDNLLALFWDDLDSQPGGVFYKFDPSGHRFIVEWSRLINRFDGISEETFELILLDPDYYPTRTGDGEIIFQYLDIENVDSVHYYVTVGIENEDHSLGFQYVYGTEYAVNAAPLDDSLAIKFTTDPPDTIYTGREERTQRRSSPYIAVHPNPSRGLFRIAYSLGGSERGEYVIYDVAGRSVIRGNLRASSGVLRLDASGLRPGIYFLLVRGERTTLRKRMVIIR